MDTKSFLVFFAALFSFGLWSEDLPKRMYRVCGVSLELEEAKTFTTRQKGLMYRSSIPASGGMIFIFKRAEPQAFWMRNVPFDIDIGFFDTQGRLINFHTMKGTSPLIQDSALPRYESLKPAQFAVEVNRGFFKDKKACRLEPVPKIDSSVQ